MTVLETLVEMAEIALIWWVASSAPVRWGTLAIHVKLILMIAFQLHASMVDFAKMVYEVSPANALQVFQDCVVKLISMNVLLAPVLLWVLKGAIR